MNARRLHVRKRPRRARRGVTLIETMASAAIVGVGVISLAHVMFFAEEGISMTRKRASAMEMARQRVEWLATLPPDRVPQCLVVTGCRLDRGTYTALKPAVGPYACSELLEGMSSRDPGSNAAVAGTYRIDTTVAAHPDPSQQAGASVLSVNVCWTDQDGQVHEIQAQRLLVPEV